MPDLKLKSSEIALKYDIPLPKSMSRKRIYAPIKPVNAKIVLNEAKHIWKDDPYAKDYYTPLSDHEHAEFTSHIISAAKKNMNTKSKNLITYPVNVKTTTASLAKVRGKYFGPTRYKAGVDSKSPLPPEKDAPAEELDHLFLKKMANITILQRSKKDQRRLFKILREIEGFNDISDIYLEQMVNVGSIIKAPENSYVCDFATLNSTWYCVLIGKVTIEVKKESFENISKNLVTHNKEKGSSFGTLELISKSDSGSVLAIEETILFRIDSHDFFKATNFANEKAKKAAFLKIRCLPLFDGIREESFKSFIVMMKLKVFKRGDIICHQGHEIKHPGIIIDGKCKVSSQYAGTGHYIHLGSLNGGDYFGEQLWIHKYPNFYTFNITAESEEVKIAYFSHNEDIQAKMVESKFTVISQTAQSLEEWLSDGKIKRWEDHERKQQLIGLVREFTKNPRITTIEQCNTLYKNYL